MRRWLRVTLALVGCSDGRDTLTLSDLSDRKLVTGVSSRDGFMSVQLRYSLPTSGHPDVHCSSVDTDTLHATLGGSTLSFSNFGSDGEHLTGIGYCYMYFSAPIVDPIDGVAEVRDPSLDIVATFAQTALEARTAIHPTWSFALGETVTLRWSHPSDLVASDIWADASLGLEPPGSPAYPVAITPPDEITFTVPADYPVGVAHAIVGIEPASTWMDSALSCEQASSCLATQNRSYAHDATVH